MAIIRGHTLLVGQTSAAISGKTGVLLSIEIQMTGRTLNDPAAPQEGFAEANMAFHAVDGAGNNPLGGNISNPIILGFNGSFDYRNPMYEEFVRVDALGLGSIQLNPNAERKPGFYSGSLTIASILIDPARSHDLNVSWEIYEFE